MTVTVAVAAPANLAAIGDSDAAIRVTWDAVPGLEETARTTDEYELQWRLSSETDADYDTARSHDVTATANPSYTIPGLTPETAYTVRVRTRDMEGSTSELSAFTVVTATTLADR